MGCGRVLTTSSSFVTTGSRLPPPPQSFGPFWGNTLKQWSQQYRHSGTAPIDLTLSTQDNTHDGGGISFDGPLRDALRDHAARDSIRSVHLQGWDTNLLRSIISSLIVSGEDIRDSSIESLDLSHSDLDISDFLARYRFPKLRVLHPSINSGISSWDHLKLQYTSLITLSLGSTKSTTNSSPTTSQLLSILASYPNLQGPPLYGKIVPRDVSNGFTLRVPLRYLKELSLRGNYFHTFRLLDQLEYPDMLGRVDLALTECVGEGIFGFLGPYLQDRIRRDGQFQGRLGIYISFASKYVSFEVSVVGEVDNPTMVPGYGHPFCRSWYYSVICFLKARRRKCVSTS